MTRKEWMQMHDPDKGGRSYAGGVLNCPYNYPELCKLDPRIPEVQD